MEGLPSELVGDRSSRKVKRLTWCRKLGLALALVGASQAEL